MGKKKYVCEENIKDVISRVAEFNGMSEESFLLKMYNVYLAVDSFVGDTYNAEFFLDEECEDPIDTASPTYEFLHKKS